MKCPHCGQEHSNNIQFCPLTGQSLILQINVCSSCGRELKSEAKFCSYCGAIITSSSTAVGNSPRRKSRISSKDQLGLKISHVLFIALGSFGIICIVVGMYLIWLPELNQDTVIGTASQITTPGGLKNTIATLSPEMGSTSNPAELTSNDTLIPIAKLTLRPTETRADLNLGGETTQLTTDKVTLPTAIKVTPSAKSAFDILPSEEWTNTPSPTSYVKPLDSVEFRANQKDGAELVLIPAGEFLMGSQPERDPYFYGAESPVHTVNLRDYWIYRTEVTNAMYRKCAAVHACPKPDRISSNTRLDYFENPQYDNYPVVYVSWKDANAYCKWAGGRMPTEAEWEKAGRGIDGRLFPWGDQTPNKDLAQFNASDTAPVGSFIDGASPYGVFDMAGNVIEWVFDWFQSTYYKISPVDNPRGPATGDDRVYRGGSYHNDAGAIRVVMRGGRRESHSNVDIGFRCVVDTP